MKINKCCVIAAALILAHGPALGDESVIDRMRTCAGEADEAKRLACYDFQMGRSKIGQNEDLGVTGELLRQKQKQAGIATAPPDDMAGKVVGIANRGFGKFVVTLDNGQVWAQQEAPDFTVRVGDLITIRRGVLGALWMVNSKDHRQARVRRIN